MSQFGDSLTTFQEEYYFKQPLQYEPESENLDSVQIPQTDFDPYYSEITNYDSELDSHYLGIHDLGLSGGIQMSANYPSHLANTVPRSDMLPLEKYNSIASDLPSDPPIAFSLPVTDRAQSQFDELPSSPPSSPPRPAPSQRTQPTSSFDSLGIRHPFIHRPQSSISKLNQINFVLPASSSISGANDREVGSPYSTPPISRPIISPYMPRIDQFPLLNESQTRQDTYCIPSNSPHSSPQLNNDLQPPPKLLTAPVMPNLSPTLSETSISPNPSSPDHGEFCWQPIISLEPSLQRESIIEQQRRPKFKRKSCLPDGVVEEYVGVTDTEGVFVCLYPGCKKLFRRTYNLRSHIQTHLRDRPYVCSICGANFVRPHDLRRHERCHSTVKPFICPCGKAFNRQDAMQRHRLREICEGAISSGVPKSSKPRGRPKGRRNTPTNSPDLADSPNLISKSSTIDSGLNTELTP